MLSIRHLTKSFREGDRVHRVLENLSTEVAAGEKLAIMGRSGSGKSTLLNLISGIDRPDAGAVYFDGREVSSLAEPARTLFRRRHIGFVYQFFHLIATLDAAANVRLVLELNGVRGAQARTRALAALQAVGLAERAAAQVEQLSGGEQQRVAIARALVHEPPLLLADEPTGNLDEASAAQVLALLDSLSARCGSTLVLVTHDEQLAQRADRVLELRDGQLQPRLALERARAP